MATKDELIKFDSGIEPYTIAPNELVQNDEMSWSARGILIYMLSKRNIPDWKFFKAEIRKHGDLGRDAFNTKWQELQRFGYLTKEQLKDDKGRYTRITETVKDKDGNEREISYGVIWTIHERPVPVEEPEIQAESQAVQAIEDKTAEMLSAAAQEVFESAFDTIDSLDDELLPEEDKQLIKDEFENEFLEVGDPVLITNFFQLAWETAQEQCKNDDYFAQYLVNNMKKQAKIHRLNQAKAAIEKAKLAQQPAFNIPMDGPWNE